MQEKTLQAVKPEVPLEYAQKILNGIVDVKGEILDNLLDVEYLIDSEAILRKLGAFIKFLFEEGQAYCSFIVYRDTLEIISYPGTVINVSNAMSLEDVQYTHRFGDETYTWKEMLRVDLEEIVAENNRWWRAYAWLPIGDVIIEEQTSLTLMINIIVMNFLVFSIKKYKES